MDTSEKWAQVVAGKEVGILWVLVVCWYALAIFLPDGSGLRGVLGQPIFMLAFPPALIGYSWPAIAAWFYLLAVAFAVVARWSGVFELAAWRSVLNKETKP